MKLRNYFCFAIDGVLENMNKPTDCDIISELNTSCPILMKILKDSKTNITAEYKTFLQNCLDCIAYVVQYQSFNRTKIQ